MKSALALLSLSVLCGTAHNSFQEALLQHDVLTFPTLAKFAAAAAPPLHLLDVVRLSAQKHGVQPNLVKSIIKAESAFRPDAVSNKGAIGLMQLMPETAQQYGAQDPTVPEQNIDAGTKYLGWLLKRYQNKKNGLPLAIAAYNAGPGNVDKYKGIPPFRETQTYVSRVMSYHRQLEGLPEVVEKAKPSRKVIRMALVRHGRVG